MKVLIILSLMKIKFLVSFSDLLRAENTKRSLRGWKLKKFQQGNVTKYIYLNDADHISTTSVYIYFFPETTSCLHTHSEASTVLFTPLLSFASCGYLLVFRFIFSQPFCPVKLWVSTLGDIDFYWIKLKQGRHFPQAKPFKVTLVYSLQPNGKMF